MALKSEVNINVEATQAQAVEHIMKAVAEITVAVMTGRLSQRWMIWDIRGIPSYNGAGLFSFDPEKRVNFITEIRGAIDAVIAENKQQAS